MSHTGTQWQTLACVRLIEVFCTTRQQERLEAGEQSKVIFSCVRNLYSGD